MIASKLLRARPSRQISLLGRHGAPNNGRFARRIAPAVPSQVRFASNKSDADQVIEDIQDQYATARDEFEIAVEETEKQTVYAEDDRSAAREELDKLHEVYNKVVNGSDKQLADDVRSRVGQRIRELDVAVQNMEELAQNQD